MTNKEIIINNDKQIAKRLERTCEWLIKAKIAEQICFLDTTNMRKVESFLEKYAEVINNISDFIITCRKSYDALGKFSEIRYTDLYFICDVTERYAKVLYNYNFTWFPTREEY